MDELIDFIHGDLDQITLPVNSVDVMVSEWMGYFLLFEGMLGENFLRQYHRVLMSFPIDSVLFARDRYLVPGGQSKSPWSLKVPVIENWLNKTK